MFTKEGKRGARLSRKASAELVRHGGRARSLFALEGKCGASFPQAFQEVQRFKQDPITLCGSVKYISPHPRSFRKTGTVFGYEGPLQLQCAINTSQLVSMKQGEESGDDLRVWASLTRNETQVNALEIKLSAMNNQ